MVGIILTLALLVSPQAGPKAGLRDAPIYVVNSNFFSEGKTPEGETPRFGQPIMRALWRTSPRVQESESNTKGPKDPRPAWSVRTGDRLQLYFGGRKASDIVVEDIKPYQCNLYAAVVRAEQPFTFKKREFAIATAGPVRESGSAMRRAVTPEERESVLKAAKLLTAKQGYRALKVATGTKLDSLAAVRFAEGEEWSYVVTSTTLTPKGKAIAFLILDKAFKPVHQNVRLSTDVQDGSDYISEEFADVFDVNGDGTMELVTFLGAYEMEAFVIYERRGTKWVELGSMEAGGCG